LMQAQSRQRVRTFTIGFHESAYDEAPHARAVASCLGTEHTEIYVTASEARQIIPALAKVYDEPFGDSSAIPSLLLAQLTRQHVTVSLSGDGGDELFGGYRRYQRSEEIWSRLRHAPHFARSAVAKSLSATVGRSQWLGDSARRIALYLAASSREDCYEAQILQRDNAQAFVLGSSADPPSNGLPASDFFARRRYASMMYADTMRYLPDDVLVKVDRASMSVGLETRVPMLDHSVVELAWSLPSAMLVRRGVGKWLLKQMLRKHVPSRLIDRPKMGFGVPIGDWLRGPLRDWAEELLSTKRLTQDGFLNARLARAQLAQHIRGQSAAGDGVWQLLMFQAWVASVHPR
jgi:asparagine synthase (glutamine-hydrolysing)